MRVFITRFFSYKKTIFFIIFMLLIGFLGSGYVLSTKPEEKEFATVKRGLLKETLTLSGTIHAKEHVVLQFQTGGLLTYVGVKEGDQVKKLQTIASLDQRQVQKNLQKYLNTYLKTRQDFDQTKDTYEDSILSDAIKRVLQKSQSDLENSVIDVELYDLSKQLANLWTPIEGIVTRVDTPQAGVNIYLPNQAQFEIVNPKTLFFKVSAEQTEVTEFIIGQKGIITFDSYPDESISAEIATIAFSPEKNESGTVYSVEVTFPHDTNGNLKYRLGMTGDITFTVKEKDNVLFIPTRFIKTDEKGKFLLVGDEKKTIYVETGLESDTDIEITDGINEGDIVYD